VGSGYCTVDIFFPLDWLWLPELVMYIARCEKGPDLLLMGISSYRKCRVEVFIFGLEWRASTDSHSAAVEICPSGLVLDSCYGWCGTSSIIRSVSQPSI
jgi:hypothetical protein